MSLKSILTPNPQCVGPDATLMEAAQFMKTLDVGMLPVCEQERLIGTVTDRDITIRGVADGLSPITATVREVMTHDVVYCFDHQSIDEAARVMEEKQIRRLPIVNEQKRLVGIVSLGDLAVRTRSELRAGEVLEGVSEPTPPGLRPGGPPLPPGTPVVVGR